MGGYGLYVWGSYAMAAALMLLEPLLARQRLRQALRDAVARTDHTDHTDHTESRP
jgi:heme exporter protein D